MRGNVRKEERTRDGEWLRKIEKKTQKESVYRKVNRSKFELR